MLHRSSTPLICLLAAACGAGGGNLAGWDLLPPPSAEPGGPDPRLRDTDGAAGDSPGKLSFVPGDRGPAAAAELGRTGRGGATAGDGDLQGILGIAIMLAVIGLNFLGDGLRDLFDPKREGAKL